MKLRILFHIAIIANYRKTSLQAVVYALNTPAKGRSLARHKVRKCNITADHNASREQPPNSILSLIRYKLCVAKANPHMYIKVYTEHTLTL